MKKNLILTLLILAAFLVGCTAPAVENQPASEESAQQISVAVTFYPYFDLTRSIVGDAGTVTSVVPATTEPHSFSPSARDIADLQNIDVYVKTGVEFEAFEDTLLDGVPASALVIDASKGIELLEGGHDDHGHGHEEKHDDHDDESHDEHEEHSDEEHHEEHEENHSHEEHSDEEHEEDHDEHEEEHAHEDHHEDEEHHDEEEKHVDEHGHDHSGADPHVWLSPKNAITIVNNIETDLVANFPEHAETFSANAQALKNQLTALDQEFAAALDMCEQDTVLVTHNAYAYLAAEYGFKTESISGLSPESEPTPAQLAKLVDEAEELGIKYVFFEELVNPDVAQVIADEVGAGTLTINPVAGSNEDSGYIAIMRNNLEQLAIGLECQ